MKSLEDMTPDELRAYADKIEESEKYNVKKRAEVSQNIYVMYFDTIRDDLKRYIKQEGEPITENEMDEVLFYIKEQCKVASEGDRCECLIDDGDEYWYGYDCDGIEDWTKEMARKWFKNIKDMK